MLDTAVAVMRRCPRAVLGPAAAVVTFVQVCLTLISYYFIGTSPTDSDVPEELLRSVGNQLVLTVIGMFVTGFAILVLAGFYAPVVARSFFGLPPEPWADGRPSRVRLVFVALAGMVGPLLAFALPLVPFVLVANTGGSAGLGILLGFAGFPAGAALAAWIYVLVVLAGPAVVMERAPFAEAFRRASGLVRRRWWKTFLVLVLTGLITVFMGFIALRVPFLLIELFAFGTEPSGAEELWALAVNTLGRIVSWTITVPFDALVVALVYFDLRMRREGVDLRLQTLAEPPAGFMDLWRGR
ncbi:hypothetical protein GCM10010468_76580 [Actinocorallia longicatena]|uniref:Glycerophosphoryl diester phosphodiesterase membrane domain-containing protein n=2 Tax=Actinocorallia longicatena TaxID=111803 RepID=A0ABP6QLG2_9ACTN